MVRCGRVLFVMSPIEIPLEVYWRRGCGACASLKMALAEAGVVAHWHDIWDDPDAAAFVRSVADGDETVPTVRVGERILVAPRPRAVLDELQALDPSLVPSARAWPPLRVLQWAAIIVLLVASALLSQAGHAALSWAADAVALAVYVVVRRLRSRARSARERTRAR